MRIINKNPNRIALILSALNVRRLIPGLQHFVKTGRNYWLIDIYRPNEEIGNLIEQWNPTGIITEWIPQKTEMILKLNYPTVLITSKVSRPHTAQIDIDNHSIGQQAANHFIRLGLKNFAYYGNKTPYSEERETGFKEFLPKEDIFISQFYEGSGKERQYIEHWHEGNLELKNWIRSLPKPVGIFVAHDPLGRTIAETCRDMDIDIPGSVSILGANDDELVCGMTNPPLSSVRIPWMKMGFEAGQLMEGLMENPALADQPTKIIPHGDIVTRESSDLLAVDNPALAKALKVIREKACEGLSVKELTAEVKVSRRHLEQTFRRLLKKSPREEILRIRFLRARLLLRETDFTMPRIADECGFSSAELFATNFKKQFNLTPRSYRRAFRIQKI